MFESKEDISDFVEDGETGVTVSWAKDLGKNNLSFLKQ